jgi:phosphate/phosphite/phosphonate ABC transporter binding protein
MFNKLREICSRHKFICLSSAGILIILLALTMGYKGKIRRYISGKPPFSEKEGEGVITPDFRPLGRPINGRKIIRIGGSAAVYPFFRILGQEFERRNPKYKVVFLPDSHTKGGVMGVVTKECDIGLMSRNFTDEEKKQDVYRIPFALDGVSFALHTSVGVKNLTTRQILDIYSGKITNWKEVGGNDVSIVVLDRPEHTSAKKALRKTLFSSDFKVTPYAIILETPKQASESLKFMPNSIGYTSFRDNALEDVSLIPISIDNVFPSPANVKKRIYPHFRKFSLVVGPRPEKKIMHLFNFIFGDDGVRIIEKNGYGPVTMELVIATIPEQNIVKQENRYRPLVNYLKKELGNKIKISLRHLPGYGDIVEEFMSGNVNVAFFGSMTYGIAPARLGVEPVARPERDGVSQYSGLILTRIGGGIRRWQDLRGKSFSMIKATTAADLFPRLFLKKRGVKRIEDFFGRIHYAGSHDASIEMILNGTVDAGAAKDLIFEKMARENPRIKKDLTVLTKSLPVPENALVIRRDLDIVCYNCHFNLLGDFNESDVLCNYIKQRLQDALLNLDRYPEGRDVLMNLGADRFLLTSDKDYHNLYEMTRELGIDLARYPLH